MEEVFVRFLRNGDTRLLLRQMRDTGWRVGECCNQDILRKQVRQEKFSCCRVISASKITTPVVRFAQVADEGWIVIRKHRANAANPPPRGGGERAINGC